MVMVTEIMKASESEEQAAWPARDRLPPEYPSELERDVVIGDLHCTIRPIVPDDADRLATFHRKLSPYSQYLRFFGCHPALSPEEVRHFTTVDYSRRMALVAVMDGQIIGVGRFDREPGSDEAEVAFVVADEFHRHGIATLLLDQLVAAARCRGVTTFVAHTLWENLDMLSVFQHSGFDVHRSVDSSVVSLQFPIRTTSSSCLLLSMRNAERHVTPHAGGECQGQH
jgi:RimJ/RimL family protein N-acetyltransferase